MYKLYKNSYSAKRSEINTNLTSSHVPCSPGGIQRCGNVRILNIDHTCSVNTGWTTILTVSTAAKNLPIAHANGVVLSDDGIIGNVQIREVSGTVQVRFPNVTTSVSKRFRGQLVWTV